MHSLLKMHNMIIKFSRSLVQCTFRTLLYVRRRSPHYKFLQFLVSRHDQYVNHAGKAQSGDVDVLIVPPAGMEQLPPTTLPLLLHRLEQQGFLTDHLALPTGYHSLLKQALLLQEEEEQKEEKEQGNNQEQDLKEKREYIGQHLHGSTNDKNCALNVPVESDSVRENSLHLCGGDSVASSEVAPYMASGDIARDTEVTEAGSTSGTAGGFATWLQRTGVDSTLIRG